VFALDILTIVDGYNGW